MNTKIISIFSTLLFLLACTSVLAAKDPFGINVDDPNARDLHFSTARQAGFRWARLSADWREMEQTQGTIDFSSLDERVAVARAKGLNILLTFVFIPSWANGTLPTCIPFIDNNCSVPPTNPQFFADFVTAVVDRYQGKIEYYCIWNEPTLEVFWGGSQQEYIDDILINGSQAAKAANPTVKIVGPDTVFDSDYFSGVLSQACSHIDIVSAHFYPGNFSGSANAMISDIEAHYLPSIQSQCNKPFWITEFGIQSEIIGEEIQAQEYYRALELALEKTYIDKLFLYRLEDHSDASGLKVGIAGTVEAGMPPKPSFFSVWNIISRTREERVLTIDQFSPSLLALSGSGQASVQPLSAISVGLPWGFGGCSSQNPICSANDNLWNAENGAIDGALLGYNIFAAFPPFENAPQTQISISDLPNGATFDLYGRYLTSTGAFPRGILLGTSVQSLITLNQTTPGATILRELLGVQEREVKFATAVISGNTLHIFLDDDPAASESIWSGVRIQNPDFNYSAGTFFADGFESGTTAAWSIE